MSDERSESLPRGFDERVKVQVQNIENLVNELVADDMLECRADEDCDHCVLMMHVYELERLANRETPPKAALDDELAREMTRKSERFARRWSHPSPPKETQDALAHAWRIGAQWMFENLGTAQSDSNLQTETPENAPDERWDENKFLDARHKRSRQAHTNENEQDAFEIGWNQCYYWLQDRGFLNRENPHSQVLTDDVREIIEYIQIFNQGRQFDSDAQRDRFDELGRKYPEPDERELRLAKFIANRESLPVTAPDGELKNESPQDPRTADLACVDGAVHEIHRDRLAHADDAVSANRETPQSAPDVSYLEKVLEFYADPANYEYDDHGWGPDGPVCDRAQAALCEIREKQREVTLTPETVSPKDGKEER